MSRPGRTLPSDARTSQRKPKQEKAESKEEASVDDVGGPPPMRQLAVGGGSAPRPGNRSGARIISGIRDGSARAAEAVESPELAPEAPVVKDLATFEEVVGGLVDTTVAQASTSADETVRAMAAQLHQSVQALRAGLPKTPSELERAVADLLRYQETVAREAAEVARLQEADLAATVRFGTEITFSDPSLHGLFVDPDEKCDKKALQKSQAAADKYLQDWERAVGRRFPTGKGFTLDIAPADPLSRPGARRFTFTGQGWDDSGQPVAVSWWYQTNVDNCCLELQTAPATLGQFSDGMIARWAQSIFDTAEHLKLQSGPASMGGGHLSMDRSSTFGDSAILFSRMVRIYNARAHHGGIHQSYTDDDAPFLEEMDRKGSGKLSGEYQELMVRVEKSMLDPSATLSVAEVRNQLWRLLTSAKPYRDKLNNHGRYTALNIEPVTDDKDPGKQRVEFRRFQGQADLRELCAQLEELLGLVDQARKG